MKVLRFLDGRDVTLVPESAVESIGSFSPTGATLTLKSGQEVVVDRNAGVDAVEVDSIEEMVRMLVGKKKEKNGIQACNSFTVIPGGCREVSEVPAERRGDRGQRGWYIVS